VKLGLVVNDVFTESPGYTTTRLAVAALQLGHEVWEMGVGDLAYDPDDSIRARARTVPRKKYKTTEGYLKDLHGKNAVTERISIDELDVVMLRNDPASDAIRYPNYVPFEELAREYIEGIEQGIYDVRVCERCAGYFDLNRTEGIFSRPADLTGFICMPCAESMTAREYFERYLRVE